MRESIPEYRPLRHSRESGNLEPESDSIVVGFERLANHGLRLSPE